MEILLAPTSCGQIEERENCESCVLFIGSNQANKNKRQLRLNTTIPSIGGIE